MCLSPVLSLYCIVFLIQIPRNKITNLGVKILRLLEITGQIMFLKIYINLLSSSFLFTQEHKVFSLVKSRLYSYHSAQFSSSVVSDSLRPHELQHARPPCPSQTPRVYSNS